jgi:hypothetical protein
MCMQSQQGAMRLKIITTEHQKNLCMLKNPYPLWQTINQGTEHGSFEKALLLC